MGGAQLLEWYANQKQQLPIEEVRARLEEALDQVYAVLEKPTRKHGAAGKMEVWSLCPFHDDHSVGSFSVNLSNGAYHCFVCGAAGGLYGLLHQTLGRDKASRIMADITPEALELLHGETDAGDLTAQPMLPIPESVMATYSLLPKRLIETKNHPRELVEDLGIRLDLRAERILYPVRDMQGRLVGIQTRSAVDTNPGRRWQWYDVHWLKRVLPPEDIEAWGLGEYVAPRNNMFYLENRSMAGWPMGVFNHPVVLMEGMGHCLRCLEAGYAPAGMFGTELGAGQILRLWKIYTRFGIKLPIIICLDADVPGRHASYRAAFQLMSIADVRIALLPLTPGNKYDPEDLSPGQLRALLKNAARVQDILADTDDDEFGYAMTGLNQVMTKLARRRDLRAAKRERVEARYGQKRTEEVDLPELPTVHQLRAPTPSIGHQKEEALSLLSRYSRV